MSLKIWKKIYAEVSEETVSDENEAIENETAPEEV